MTELCQCLRESFLTIAGFVVGEFRSGVCGLWFRFRPRCCTLNPEALSESQHPRSLAKLFDARF